jgi:hypothetical protein
MSCQTIVYVTSSGTVCTTDTAASCNCPPSPVPPWSREARSGQTQRIVDNDVVNLAHDPTYLEKVVSDPSASVTVTLPNGNRKGQHKRIMIPGDSLATTETFTVSGTFAGFTTLTFDAVGYNALLEWDGAAWQFMGGNARQDSQP